VTSISPDPKYCHTFIGRSPFVLIASSDSEGRMAISPKGDAPGFVKILDEKTLAIPDRPGNQRFDTFCNLFQSPRVGLIFLIPGKRETLRITRSQSSRRFVAGLMVIRIGKRPRARTTGPPDGSPGKTCNELFETRA